MKYIAAIVALLIAALGAAAGPAYPLKISPGQHYLVDQNNTPFFIQGDSPWYLIQRLDAADVDTYLSNRWVQGYNSIILDLQSHKWGSGGAFYPSADVYGNNPFTNTIGDGHTNFWRSIQLLYQCGLRDQPGGVLRVERIFVSDV
jgi:hypothetical protein